MTIMSLTDNYVHDAIAAEREGVEFPIDFDVAWEEFGFKHKYHAKRFLQGILETLVEHGLSRSGCAVDESEDSDKYCLSVKGFKFALARAKTVAGAMYLLHLLSLEEKSLKDSMRSLEASLYLPISETAETAQYPYSDFHLWEATQYTTLAYTRKVIRTDYLEGSDYIALDGKYYLTKDAASILVFASRSKRGTSNKGKFKLPFELEKHKQAEQRIMMNRRRLQSLEYQRKMQRLEDNGQTTLL